MGTKQSLSRARSIPVNRGTTHAQRSPSVSVSPLATLQMQAATADPQVASPGTLLALQRLYGNQAVQRLCAPSLALTRTQRSSAAAQAPVQRSPGATLQRSDAVAAQSNRQPLKASSAPLNRIHRSFVKPNKTHYAVTPGVAQRSRSEDVPDKYASAQNNRWGAETLQTKPAKRVSSPSSVRRPVLRSSRLPTLRRRIQATLIVGAADDPYEREAERVAAQVSGVRTAPARASVSVQRTSHAPAMGLEGGEAGRELEHQIASTHGGALLPNETRIFMERRIGADFSGVHIHASAQAAQLNRSLGAQAFTHGSNVFMGEGSYNPTSSSGRHLLAHELTHVVQQNAATVSRAPAEAQSPKPDVPAAQRVSRRVQRNVGFEFETNNLITKRGNGGPLPAAGFADAGAAATAFKRPECDAHRQRRTPARAQHQRHDYRGRRPDGRL